MVLNTYLLTGSSKKDTESNQIDQTAIWMYSQFKPGNMVSQELPSHQRDQWRSVWNVSCMKEVKAVEAIR